MALTTDLLADLRGDLGAKNTQTVTLAGMPTGGTFALTYKGQTTTALAYDADGQAVEAALQALSTILIGNATVTGAAKGPYTIYIIRDDGTPLTVTSALTGGVSPAAKVQLNVVFSDDELNRLYARASSDYPDTAYPATVVYALRQLLANASKMVVYTLGTDGLNKQKVFENLKIMLDIWSKIAGIDSGSLSVGTMSLELDLTIQDIDWSLWW